MRFKKTNKGFINIEDVSDYFKKYKYQVSLFKLDDASAEPITKRAKNKTDALKIARKFAKKL